MGIQDPAGRAGSSNKFYHPGFAAGKIHHELSLIMTASRGHLLTADIAPIGSSRPCTVHVSLTPPFAWFVHLPGLPWGIEEVKDDMPFPVRPQIVIIQQHPLYQL
jgi:hypothetical protein